MNIAIITGASSGMGKEFFLQLDKNIEVDEVFLIARREEKLKELAALKPTLKVRILPYDLSKEESLDAIASLIEKEKPNIKLLVNCAGIGQFGSFENTPRKKDEDIVNLNCRALLSLTRICVPFMEKGSYIVQVGSMSSYQPTPYMATYSATKAFVLSYSRALGVELKPKGIRVMCLTPMYVKTEFFEGAFVTNDNKVKNFDKFYTAEEVVRQGYHDLLKTKKEYSALGFFTKLQILLVKLLPHSLIMKIWLKQQSKEKNLDKALEKHD